MQGFTRLVLAVVDVSFPLPAFSKPRARNVVARPPFSAAPGRGGLTASGILALAPAAWFRYNRGITVTGAGVSQWDDQSGNARHLKQGTDTNRPALQADGSILFDGVDNFLKCDAFTLNQPETVFLLAKQITWNISLYIFDGNASATMAIQQAGTTPEFRQLAGGAAGVNETFPLDSYFALAAVYNGAASQVWVNKVTNGPANRGANNAGGFTLGSLATGSGNSNIQVKEVIIFPVAMNAAMVSEILRYLARLGGFSY